MGRATDRTVPTPRVDFYYVAFYYVYSLRTDLSESLKWELV